MMLVSERELICRHEQVTELLTDKEVAPLAHDIAIYDGAGIP